MWISLPACIPLYLTLITFFFSFNKQLINTDTFLCARITAFTLIMKPYLHYLKEGIEDEGNPPYPHPYFTKFICFSKLGYVLQCIITLFLYISYHVYNFLFKIINSFGCKCSFYYFKWQMLW